MTMTLPAKPATTLIISNRGSVRRGSGFVLVGYSEVDPILALRGIRELEATSDVFAPLNMTAVVGELG